MKCSCGADMDSRKLLDAFWTRYECPRCGTVKYKDIRTGDVDTITRKTVTA